MGSHAFRRRRAGMMVLASGLTAFLTSDLISVPELADLNQRLDRAITGYTGCRCGDCLNHFSVVPRTYWGGCTRPARSLVDVIATSGAAWLVAVVGAVVGLPRRRSADEPPACRRCGYDLRGLRAGAVCPECGAATDRAGTGRLPL